LERSDVTHRDEKTEDGGRTRPGARQRPDYAPQPNIGKRPCHPFLPPTAATPKSPPTEGPRPRATPPTGWVTNSGGRSPGSRVVVRARPSRLAGIRRSSG